MYGLMLSEGYIKNKEIIISFDKTELVDFTIQYLKQNGITYIQNNIGTITQLIWKFTSKFKFTMSQLYKDTKVKSFDNMMLHLPQNKIKYILKAFIDNDGAFVDNIIKIGFDSNIIDGLKYILLRMGILCSSEPIIFNDVNMWILKIPIVTQIATLLNIELINTSTNYIVHNNIIYTSIDNIVEEEIDTIVYDLEIENNHNYLTQAGLVHNGGKRKGSIAFYLEPHHADIKAFLDLRKNSGAETERARDLFTALWISDLFMKQVEIDGDWYLMCPDTCPNLNEVYGDEYESLYWEYVKLNKYKEKVKARAIWQLILESQIETGTPYICFKDSVNKKSNQKNIGTIKSSNLCAEILEYSDDKEYAVCNLASIAINKFVEPFIFKADDKWKIYTKDNCKFCIFAKTYLENKKIVYEEIKNELPLNTKTYPQIFHNNVHVGGYDDLFDYTCGKFNYEKLYETAYIATKNLNKIIDINFYPVIEAKRSNLKHRPIGLGIQGLADALVLLKIPYDSEESVNFNKKMMETIYLAAITASKDISLERRDKIKLLLNKLNKNVELPYFYDPNFIEDELYHELKLNSFEVNKEFKGSYSTFKGSPISEGKFQFDLWNVEPIFKDKWNDLREEIKKYGVRNSLVTALMPTASTSQILGNNECFEFFTNNIYTRRTLAGDFPLVNKYLIDDLNDLNLWTLEMKQMIIANNGSINTFTNIPQKIKRLYQTIWEIKQIWTLKNAVARGPYVDQTQSMNIYMTVPDFQKLYSSHFWAWKNGLKTGIYYLRTKPAKEATKITVDNNIINKIKIMTEEHEVCESCSA